MTAMTAADSCAKAGTYKYEVPDLGEGTYRVIFSNGSGSQMPGPASPVLNSRARRAGMVRPPR